ncbi:MAG TPA: zf-HC2 domain-containing protein [Polyangia bacterium]|jgi:hypothetical protein
MSTRCEDVSDRLLELLYEELPADERAALEAHVAGCERCRAEVASFQKTRAVARSVLIEPAPAGVRQRLVAAAMAAAPATKPALAPARAGADARTEEKSAGIGAWLRRHWTLPTLATVGAMAVFLLASRVFLNPEKTYERGQAVTAAPPSPAAAESPPAPPPAMNDDRAAAPSSSGAIANRTARAKGAGAASGLGPRVSLHQLAGGMSAPARDGLAEPGSAPTTAAPAKRKAATDDLLDGLASDKPIRRGKKDIVDNALEAAPSGAAVGGGAPRAELHRFSPKAEGIPLPQPFPGVDERERAPAQAQQRAATPPPPPVAVASPPPAAPAAPVFNEDAVARKSRRIEEPAPPASDVVSAKSNVSAASRAAAEPLPQRAERLFREGRWSEAATAFEQLLRQFPQSPSVPRWRQRLSAARAAAEAASTPPSP